jgi:hypothetical protein
LATLLAIGFAGREARIAAVTRAAESRLEARQAELAARLREAQRARRQREREEAALAQAARGASLISASLAPAASPMDSSVRRSSWLAAHPAERRGYLAAFRAGLTLDWGLLFKTLGLSADQVEKLKDILTQREDDDITVESAAAARGVGESDPEIAALDDRLDAASKAAIRALVGQPDYQAIHQYMHDQAVVPVVNQLAETVYAGNEPLTADQAMALTRALAASSTQTQNGRAIDGTVDWDAAQARAAAILTPAQLAAFADIRQQGQATQQVKQMTRALAGAAP